MKTLPVTLVLPALVLALAVLSYVTRPDGAKSKRPGPAPISAPSLRPPVPKSPRLQAPASGFPVPPDPHWLPSSSPGPVPDEAGRGV